MLAGKPTSCFASFESEIKASGWFRHGALFAENKSRIPIYLRWLCAVGCLPIEPSGIGSH